MDLLSLCIVPLTTAHGHPPTSNDFKKGIPQLSTAIQKFSPLPDIIIRGDFNLPHVSWPTGTPVSGASNEEKRMLNTLNDLCNNLPTAPNHFHTHT